MLCMVLFCIWFLHVSCIFFVGPISPHGKNWRCTRQGFVPDISMTYLCYYLLLSFEFQGCLQSKFRCLGKTAPAGHLEIIAEPRAGRSCRECGGVPLVRVHRRGV